MLVRFDSKAGSITLFGEVAARSLALRAQKPRQLSFGLATRLLTRQQDVLAVYAVLRIYSIPDR